jgi:hypothetical protein
LDRCTRKEEEEIKGLGIESASPSLSIVTVMVQQKQQVDFSFAKRIKILFAQYICWYSSGSSSCSELLLLLF